MTARLDTRSIDYLLAEKALERLDPTSDLSEVSSFGGSLDGQKFKTLLLDFLSDALKLPSIEYSIRESEMRLRIALHFSCPEAVNFNNGATSLTRWGLIKKHIHKNFAFSPEESEKIARLCAKVLDDWDTTRKSSLQTRRNKLLQRQNFRCACCNLNFNDKERVAKEEELSLIENADPFKPYFDGDGVTLAMAPQVDHKTVVSKDGTNQTDNLQVLCGLCNQGKGANSGIRPSKELMHSHLSVVDIPRGHKMSLIYYRLMMDQSKCSSCSSDVNELTVRKICEDGLISLTNLKTICYDCLNSKLS
jgi:hypothetical protein